MKRLCTLFEERGEAYGNADVRVSLESMISIVWFLFDVFFLPLTCIYQNLLVCDDMFLIIDMAIKLGFEDVIDISPTEIALEVFLLLPLILIFGFNLFFLV